MLLGLLILLLPITIYLVSLGFARRLRQGFCRIYLFIGAIIVFGGSATSLYFAMYTGDQGGIAAFYFQILIIIIYIIFSIGLLITNYLVQKRDQKKYES